jgi:hypothetical protein
MAESVQREGIRLRTKADWPRARARYAAFWERTNDDRPLLFLQAPLPGAPPEPAAPADLESYWLDPEYLLAANLWRARYAHHAAEAFPSAFLLAGYATGCGPGVGFAPDTVWHPLIQPSLDEPLRWRPGADDPWRARLLAVVERLLVGGAGEFLVGNVGQLPANDLLSLLLGMQPFLEELATRPALCRRRLLEMLPVWQENFEAFRAVLEPRQGGIVWGWPGLWCDELVQIAQSDLSCMISAAAFEYYVMPELDWLGEQYGRIWYHVDGRLAKRHLPRLLRCPRVITIQYVPSPDEPANGPAHMDFYREVQAAGRGLDLAVPPEHLEYLIRHLRPEGVILRSTLPSPEQAEGVVEAAARWTGSHLRE